MTREKMLELLEDLPYVVIWPGSWEDIGFTEREIWLNNLGYGYFMCDEPNPQHWDGKGLDEETWNKIKPKLEDEELEYCDIKGTPLETLLNELNYCEYDFEDKAELNSDLECLLNLRNGPCGYIYASKEDDTKIFDSEAEFKSSYERDWATVYWNDMDDELLNTWINRILDETDPELKKWCERNNLKQKA